MVTRAELQRQTRQVQLARQIRSRRIEELQQQALTQRSLLKQQELLKQQQQVEKQVSRTPTITERAFEQIIKAAEGKRTAVTSDIANEYQRLLIENPELQDAVNRGQVAGLRARELGFTSTAEFLGVSQALTRPKTPTITLKPTIAEQELRQNLPKDIRNLPIQEILTRQNFLAGQSEAQVKRLRDVAISKLLKISKQPLQIPIFVGAGGTIEASKIREGIRELGLPGKVTAEFIPVTKGDLALFTAVAGAASASKVVRLSIQTLAGLTALDTEQAPETRIAGSIVAIAPFVAKIGLPKGKKASAQAFAELESFFKRQTKKKSGLDLLSISEALRFRRVGKKGRRLTTQQERLSDIRKMFERIKQTEDPVLKQKQIQGIIKFLEITYGKAKARALILEFLTQEGIFISPKGSILTNVKKLVRKRTKIRVKLTPRQKQIQKQKEKQKQAILQVSRQIQKLRQVQRQKPRQKQKLKNIFFVSTKTVQKQVTRPRARPKIRPRPKIKPIPPVKMKKLTPTQDKLRKAIQVLGSKKAMNVVVGLKVGKRKIVGRGLAPYRAIHRGQSFVDTNLAASYKLVPTGKKPKKKDIKPFLTSPKFRQSKTNPFFQVEKRKHRLDHPQEVKQLKLFKGKVSSGFFPKIKKKRRRKKKK